MKKNSQNQVLMIANKVAGAFGPAMAQKAVRYLLAQQTMSARIDMLKKLAANDNGAPISRHLLDQLADIMSFMAVKKKMDVAVMATLLMGRFQISKLSDLRDDPFQE